MRKRLIIATALFLSGSLARGQEPAKQWSLEECIRYAIEHNIELKQREQDQESRKVELNTSKFSWLPDLNANIELRLRAFSFQIRCDCGSELG